MIVKVILFSQVCGTCWLTEAKLKQAAAANTDTRRTKTCWCLTLLRRALHSVTCIVFLFLRIFCIVSPGHYFFRRKKYNFIRVISSVVRLLTELAWLARALNTTQTQSVSVRLILYRGNYAQFKVTVDKTSVQFLKRMTAACFYRLSTGIGWFGAES